MGAVFCLNLATGEAAYTERMQQGCWATPVGIGDRVYIFGKDGLTTVLASGEKFQVLAENTLWSTDKLPINRAPTAEEDTEQKRRAAAMFQRPTLYGVAVVNGSLVVRTGSRVFCIRNKPTTEKPTAAPVK